MRDSSLGFTLIEIMIILAIISVLASIAFVTYQEFTIRSQVTAGLTDIAGGRSAFESLVVTRSLTTFNVDDIGLQSSTPRCEAIEMQSGPDGFIRCVLIGHPAIRGETVTLQRRDDDQWECNISSINPRYHPDGCQ